MHMEYARTLAALVYGRRVTDDVEFGDYLQYARIGLLEAFERFEPAHGVQFRTFAAHRIRGAILDGVAQLSERQQQAALRRRVRHDRATSLLEDADPAVAGGRGVLEQLAEVALGLAIGILLEDTGMFADESTAPAAPDGPYRSVALKQTRARLDEMVHRLAESERRVIKQHYHYGHPFEQIAREVGVTKGRISQIHKQALQSLRAMLSGAHALERS
jgi:RNA polymerase sigma factor FliA